MTKKQEVAFTVPAPAGAMLAQTVWERPRGKDKRQPGFAVTVQPLTALAYGMRDGAVVLLGVLSDDGIVNQVDQYHHAEAVYRGLPGIEPGVLRIVTSVAVWPGLDLPERTYASIGYLPAYPSLAQAGASLREAWEEHVAAHESDKQKPAA